MAYCSNCGHPVNIPESPYIMPAPGAAAAPQGRKPLLYAVCLYVLARCGLSAVFFGIRFVNFFAAIDGRLNKSVFEFLARMVVAEIPGIIGIVCALVAIACIAKSKPNPACVCAVIYLGFAFIFGMVSIGLNFAYLRQNGAGLDLSNGLSLVYGFIAGLLTPALLVISTVLFRKQERV